jgi:hypothetical protein
VDHEIGEKDVLAGIVLILARLSIDDTVAFRVIPGKTAAQMALFGSSG